MINQNGDSTDPKNCTVPKEDMDCVKYRIFRLEKRSVMTPPYGPKTRMGRYCKAVAIPSAVPEWVSSSTSQAWATDCIKVPDVEMICPM